MPETTLLASGAHAAQLEKIAILRDIGDGPMRQMMAQILLGVFGQYADGKFSVDHLIRQADPRLLSADAIQARRDQITEVELAPSDAALVRANLAALVGQRWSMLYSQLDGVEETSEQSIGRQMIEADARMAAAAVERVIDANGGVGEFVVKANARGLGVIATGYSGVYKARVHAGMSLDVSEHAEVSAATQDEAPFGQTELNLPSAPASYMHRSADGDVALRVRAPSPEAARRFVALLAVNDSLRQVVLEAMPQSLIRLETVGEAYNQDEKLAQRALETPQHAPEVAPEASSAANVDSALQAANQVVQPGELHAQDPLQGAGGFFDDLPTPDSLQTEHQMERPRERG